MKKITKKELNLFTAATTSVESRVRIIKEINDKYSDFLFENLDLEIGV